MLDLVEMATFAQDVLLGCTNQLLEMRPVQIAQLVTPPGWEELIMWNNVYLIKKTLVNVNSFLCPFHVFCNFIFSAACAAGYTKRNGVCVQCEAGTAKGGSGDHPCTECPVGSNADRTECDGKKNLNICFVKSSNVIKQSPTDLEVNFWQKSLVIL